MVQLSSSQYGFIEQTKNGSNFVVSFGTKSFNIRFCEFLLLYRKVNAFSIEDMIADISDKSDITHLVLEYGKKKLALSLVETIRLKNLFEEAMFTLRMHDMLYRAGLTFSAIEEKTLEEPVFA